MTSGDDVIAQRLRWISQALKCAERDFSGTFWQHAPRRRPGLCLLAVAPLGKAGRRSRDDSGRAQRPSRRFGLRHVCAYGRRRYNEADALEEDDAVRLLKWGEERCVQRVNL